MTVDIEQIELGVEEMNLDYLKRETIDALPCQSARDPFVIGATIEYLHSRGYLGGVPDGYVLVPKEPTEEMCWAYTGAFGGGVAEGYKAMIAAAPKGETKCN